MENNRKLGLYVSYYLARFDKKAYKNLGYGNQRETHKKIGELLDVKQQTIQNWRDEFDPLFGHRAGWYQREMNPSRTNVALALENLDEPEIRAIVEDILSGEIQNDSENSNILTSITDDNSKELKKSTFILRGPTGTKAEQFFIEYHRNNNLPLKGELTDTRDFGCGYDFEIISETSRHFIEVKGLTNNIGGILFTNKEWEMAKQEREKYTVCLVSNINESPEISFINDTFTKLNPKKNIIQTVQVQWSVSNNALRSIND